MIVYIHSHEIEDRGYTMERHAAARDVVHIIVPDGTRVPGIVELVSERVNSVNSIWTLIFNGHGDAARTGAIYFGTWINTSDVGEFAPLNRLMNRAGRGVELHCCRAGSSEEMLVNMARAFGVRVAASVDDQIGRICARESTFCLPVGGDIFGIIEGQNVVAFPDGRVLYSAADR